MHRGFTEDSVNAVLADTLSLGAPRRNEDVNSFSHLDRTIRYRKCYSTKIYTELFSDKEERMILRIKSCGIVKNP